MYVRATDAFKRYAVFPRELDFIPPAGYAFEVSPERFKVLSGDNPHNARFVEEIKENEIPTKKAGKEKNKIAIIIPNCNYAEYLETCLKSILNQTYKNFEIIFVDDMSTDNSVNVAKSLLKKPHKVIQLKQKRYNGGARNEAYLHLSKDIDYIWYVDSDDWLADETALEQINNMLQYNPDVLFVGMIEHYNGIDKPCYIPEYRDKYDAMQGWSGSCGKVIKKDLAIRQDCLYAEGTLKEDKNQHCRICIKMGSFLCLENPVYVWNRDNKKSVTTIREKIKWGTSTIRHWADTQELYLSERGKDAIIDSILEQRLARAKAEVLNGGDRQY